MNLHWIKHLQAGTVRKKRSFLALDRLACLAQQVENMSKYISISWARKFERHTAGRLGPQIGLHPTRLVSEGPFSRHDGATVARPNGRTAWSIIQRMFFT